MLQYDDFSVGRVCLCVVNSGAAVPGPASASWCFATFHLLKPPVNDPHAAGSHSRCVFGGMKQKKNSLVGWKRLDIVKRVNSGHFRPPTAATERNIRGDFNDRYGVCPSRPGKTDQRPGGWRDWCPGRSWQHGTTKHASAPSPLSGPISLTQSPCQALQTLQPARQRAEERSWLFPEEGRRHWHRGVRPGLVGALWDS